MRAILELSNGTEEFPTCFEDLQKGDCVRDGGIHQCGGFVDSIDGDYVCFRTSSRISHRFHRQWLEFYGLVGDLPEWIKA